MLISNVITKPTKYFYFDHNIWVTLHNNQVNLPLKSRNPKINDIYHKLIKMRDNKLIQIVTNVTQIIECQQRVYEESRQSIIKFVFETCNGYFHKPNYLVEDLELFNFCCEYLEFPQNKRDFYKTCVGYGFEFYMGPFDLVPKDKNDTELKEKLKKVKTEGLSLLNSLFPDEMMRMFSAKNIEAGKENVKFHLSKRDSIKDIDSFQKRKEKLMTEEFIALARKIYKKLKKLIISLKLTKNPPPFPILHTYKQRMKFMKKFPYLYSFCHLINYRNADLKRKINENDIYDIANLSVPIAYFDVVVAEKSFIALAKQIKLDSIFKTRLYSNILSIHDVLDKIESNVLIE